MKSGKWIAIEGADGVGKTTLRAEIQQRLMEKGVDPVVSREPGGELTPFGRQFREWIFAEEKWSPMVGWLFLADHMLNKAGAAAWLREGRWVLQDRSGLSQLAYAEMKSGGDPFVNSEIRRSLETPPLLDLVVILYGEPEKLAWRLEKEKGRQEEAWLKKEPSYFEELEIAYRRAAKLLPELDVIFLDSTKEAPEILAQKVIGLLFSGEAE